MPVKVARGAVTAAALYTLMGCQSFGIKEQTPITQQADNAIATELSTVDNTATVQASPEPSAVVAEQDLWGRVTDGYQFADYGLDHPRVKQHLAWFKKHPSYVKRVTERGEPYLFHIVEQLDKQSMPLELALLPIVESAFDPFAYSHGRASGIWQFIPSTGTEYGLDQNWWYDGRRDIYASTDAAVAYLGRLHRRFNHDWYLALAAYNSGQGTVSRAMRKNRSAGKGTDFFDLKLPKETRAYVPKLIALAYVIKHPEQYGVEVTPVANEPVIAQVDIDGQIDLSQAAKLAQISVDQMYRLNPGYNQWATHPQGPHKLTLPIANIDSFTSAFAALPKDERVSWQRYSVKSGDTLSQIANKFNTTQGTISSVNQLSGSMIRVGQALMIPTAMTSNERYVHTATNRAASKASKRHTAKHVITKGDSFWSLSRKYKVSTRSLASLNSMAPGDTLRVGQTIHVPSASPMRNTQTKKVNYRVRSGDSISRIATKFNVKTTDLIKWNSLDQNRYLQPGQALKIFVTVTGA